MPTTLERFSTRNLLNVMFEVQCASSNLDINRHKNKQKQAVHVLTSVSLWDCSSLWFLFFCLYSLVITQVSKQLLKVSNQKLFFSKRLLCDLLFLQSAKIENSQITMLVMFYLEKSNFVLSKWVLPIKGSCVLILTLCGSLMNLLITVQTAGLRTFMTFLVPFIFTK